MVRRRALVALGLAAVVASAGIVLTPAAPRSVVTRIDVRGGPEDGPDAKQLLRWSRRQIESALADRADALRQGDEQRYLAAVDPAQPALRASLQGMFANLRRLVVGQWSERIDHVGPSAGGAWSVRIEQRYCFGDATCRPETFVVDTQWRLDGDGLVLTQVAPTDGGQRGPRPWEAAELIVATGARTIVAASSASGIAPQDYLGTAEAAAAAADRFARWDDRPSRYVIFVANNTEFTSWFGNTGSAAGLHVAAGQVLIRHGSLDDPSFRQKVFTHELTHVATLPVGSYQIDEQWLVEGIAEYATMVGRPVSEYNWLWAVTRWLSPTAGSMTAGERTNADYGVWFLSVRYLAETFGEEALLSFFHRVVHLDQPEPPTASAVFGRDWPTLQAEIDQYIRSVA
jgi:hypothetical protein